MKKLFVSLVAAIFSLSAIASDDIALVRISLTGTTSGGTCQLVLIENPDYSTGYDNGFDAPCNINLNEALPKTLFMYSYIGSNKYSTIATNNLDGLEFGFISNLLDDEYTMTFEVFTLAPGRTLTVYDLSQPQSREIDPLNSYTFSAAAGHNEYMRFIINQAPISAVTSVTTNADGWASFAYNQDLKPASVTDLVIYKGAFDGVETLDLTAVADIPANAGVFVHGTPNTTYPLYATTATANMSGNDIEGCVNATPVSTFSGKTIYTLRYANGATALWQYTGDAAIPAGKAVLPVSTGGGANPAPKHISLRVNGTQAVDNVEAAAPAEKFIENGQVLIKRGEVVYTLQGQVVK